MQARAPIIGLFDAGGARIQEGVAALGGYGEVFKRNVIASGVIPQISRHHGPVRGRRRLFAGDDRLHLHGARHELHVRHRPGRGEDGDQRGRHRRRARRRLACTPRNPAIADGAFENDVECLLQMRRLIDFLPANNEAGVPEWPTLDDIDREETSLDTLVPGQSEQALRHQGADPEGRGRGRLLRAVARPSPRTSSPASAASPAAPSASSPTSRWCSPACSTSTPSRKAARFVRFCDAFDIPIVTFVDVPGFLPGTDAGIWRADQARRQAAVRLFARRPCRWSP